MESLSRLNSSIGYENWLHENLDLVQEYVEQNEVSIGTLPIDAHAFNSLRFNGITKMSQLVTMTPDSISKIPTLKKADVDMIFMLRRSYLRQHKSSLFLFVSEAKRNCDSISGSLGHPTPSPTDKSEGIELQNPTPINAITIPTVCLLAEPLHQDAVAQDKRNVKQGARERLAEPGMRARIEVYFKANRVELKEEELSYRSYHALIAAGITDLYSVTKLYPDGFFKIRNLGTKSIQEINRLVEFYVDKYSSEIESSSVTEVNIANPISEVKSESEVLQIGKNMFGLNSEQLNYVKQYFELHKTPIADLNLSTRSNNALRRAHIELITQLFEFYPDGFYQIRDLGKKSINEICRAMEKTVASINDGIGISGGHSEDEQDTNADASDEITKSDENISELTLPQLLCHPKYQEMARRYIEEHNVPIEAMGFSVRPSNALTRAGYTSLLSLLPHYPDNIAKLKNIGAKSIFEIQERLDKYVSILQPKVAAYCVGDFSTLYSDNYISERIMSCFNDIGFSGLSFQQMKNVLPEEINEMRIKKCIGLLLANNLLEYVDFRCYRVYPSVFDIILESTLEYRTKEILLQRFNGKTLETVAADQGLTRERVRQIINKSLRKLRSYLQSTHNLLFFDEDFYTYLYSHYDTDKELWNDYLCVPGKTFGYLTNAYSHGNRKIEDALDDPKIHVTLKLRIRDYINRNKILIDGILLDNRRSTIEDYALSKFCRNEMQYEDFADCYNRFLAGNGVQFDEKLYYTDEVSRTRSNRFSDSMLCLWKQGSRLRYYCIAERDYSDLLGSLKLDGYTNTEVSTLKLYNEYPDIMKKFDIRDQYELHNLLKKIVDTRTCNDIDFGRQPIIRFGKFDRDKAIYEIIETLSPVTAEELIEYLYTEFGYDRGTSWNYFIPFMKFYRNGVFNVDFKRVPDLRVPQLLSCLPDKFYYISEIKDIYQSLYPSADLDEINHRSLKSLGFTVLEKYVLQDYKTAESYFTDILLNEDFFSIEATSKRYNGIQMYWQTLLTLRRNLDILLFEKDQYINIRRLEQIGVTKVDLKEFCSIVFDEVEDNTYFTAYSLQDSLFSRLDYLGFDKMFFAELLSVSGLFLSVRCFGTLVFYKGTLTEGITKKSFFLETLSAYESVELDDYIADCYEQYGIRVTDRYDITRALSGTDFYYDEIMKKIYRNKDYYYAEFDD